MAHTLNRLTVRQIENAQPGAMLADGGGLYFSTVRGGRKWVFVWYADGRRREMGLGAYPGIGLSNARKLAGAVRDQVASGIDPVAARKAQRTATAAPSGKLTFGAFAADFIAAKSPGWRSDVHRKQWSQSLRDHAKALTHIPVADIGTQDVLEVLKPIWTTKPETADRVRGRIERILDAAASLGHRNPDLRNPAQWRGHLENLLPRRSKLTRGHHAALDYREAPDFMVRLRSRPALAARCLEFTILTAARSGEALGATWSEIDLQRKLWIIPKERMKAGKEHEVPLSDTAIAVLESLERTGDIIFGVGGAARSNMAMTMLLRRMGEATITVHGFRSTFRQWTRAQGLAESLCEECLAHVVGDKARNAYARGSMAEPRRSIMDAWAVYLASGDDIGALM